VSGRSVCLVLVAAPITTSRMRYATGYYKLELTGSLACQASRVVGGALFAFVLCLIETGMVQELVDHPINRVR